MHMSPMIKQHPALWYLALQYLALRYFTLTFLSRLPCTFTISSSPFRLRQIFSSFSSVTSTRIYSSFLSQYTLHMPAGVSVRQSTQSTPSGKQGCIRMRSLAEASARMPAREQ